MNSTSQDGATGFCCLEKEKRPKRCSAGAVNEITDGESKMTTTSLRNKGALGKRTLAFSWGIVIGLACIVMPLRVTEIIDANHVEVQA